MKSQNVKCAICGETFDKNSVPCVIYKKYANRNAYAHKDCYPQGEPYIVVITPEEQQKEDLCNYIIKIYNIRSPGPRMYADIKRLHDTHGFTYSGMLKTLIWYYEIQKNPITNMNTLLFIRDIYDKANEYYYNQYLMQQQVEKNKNTIEQFKTPNVRIIEITSPRAILKPPKLFSFEEENDNVK